MLTQILIYAGPLFISMNVPGVTVCTVVLIMCFASLVPVAVTGDRELSRGDVWAMGGEMEVEQFFFPGMDIDPERVVTEYHIREYGFQSEAGYYQMIRFVDEDEDLYRFSIQGAGGIHSELEYHMVGEVLSPGVQDPDDPSVEKRELSGKGQVHYTHELSVDAFFYREDLSLKSIDIYARWNFRGDFRGSNVSFTEYQDDELTIGYEDVDASFSGNRMYSLYLELNEPLEIFPMDENGTKTESTVFAVLEGNYGGYLNIKGLPETDLEKVLENFHGNEFPIYWEDMEWADAHDGIIEKGEVMLFSELEPGEWEPIRLETNEVVEALPLTFNFQILGMDVLPSLSGIWWYSPDRGFIVAQEMDVMYPLKDVVDVEDWGHVNMLPVTERVAEERMKELRYIPPLTTAETLMRAPYAHLIMLVTVVIGLFFYHRHRKKNRDK